MRHGDRRELIASCVRGGLAPPRYSRRVVVGAPMAVPMGRPVSSTPGISPGATQVSRFLSQAAFGATEADLAHVQSVGYEAWIEEQVVAPTAQSHWDWMIANGYGRLEFKNSQAGLDEMVWRKLFTAPDALRQRVALALTEMFVVSIIGFTGNWRQFTLAAYWDMLEAERFGNYRDLLEQVTLSAAMGEYLNMLGNQKENPRPAASPTRTTPARSCSCSRSGCTSSMPTARSGRRRRRADRDLRPGRRQQAWRAVFTGWNYDTPRLRDPPEHLRRPMAHNAGAALTSSRRSFLGATIPANTDGRQR